MFNIIGELVHVKTGLGDKVGFVLAYSPKDHTILLDCPVGETPDGNDTGDTISITSPTMMISVIK